MLEDCVALPAVTLDILIVLHDDESVSTDHIPEGSSFVMSESENELTKIM